MIAGGVCTTVKSSMCSGIRRVRRSNGRVTPSSLPFTTCRTNPCDSSQPAAVKRALRASSRLTSWKFASTSRTRRPSIERSTGSSSSIRQKRVSLERYQSWFRFWRCRGTPPADRHPIHLVRPRVDDGEQRLLEEARTHAQRRREEQHGDTHPVQAHPRRLQRVQLVGARQREEEEHGGHQHHDGQPVVERAGQAIDEVLDDVDERGLDAQEAIEGLQEIDDHEQHRAHAQAHAREASRTRGAGSGR